MSEHTPGPWEVIDGDCSGGWDEPGEYEYVVVTTHPEPRPNNRIASFWDSEFGYEAQANALLIAAAPDMAAEIERLKAERAELLEALGKIAKGEGAFSLDPLTFANNTIENMTDIAKAAITKAKGT